LLGDGPETELDWFEGGFEARDVGADFAAGVAVWGYLLELRYSPSFTSSYDSGGLSVRNSSYSLSLGVRLPMGRPPD
jgi:hypothetical protein